MWAFISWVFIGWRRRVGDFAAEGLEDLQTVERSDVYKNVQVQ